MLYQQMMMMMTMSAHSFRSGQSFATGCVGAKARPGALGSSSATRSRTVSCRCLLLLVAQGPSSERPTTGSASRSR